MCFFTSSNIVLLYYFGHLMMSLVDLGYFVNGKNIISFSSKISVFILMLYILLADNAYDTR